MIAPRKERQTSSQTNARNDTEYSIAQSKIKRSTLIYAALGLSILAVTVYSIGTIDIYLSAGSALFGDLYLISLTRKKHATRDIGINQGIAPLFLVAIVPPVGAFVLYLMGYMGPPLEFVLRAVMSTGFSIALLVSSFPLILAIRFKFLELRESNASSTYRPLVSILIPAYNEQEVISRTLESLMNVKYANKEIIVIDDGSTDLTSVAASWYRQFGVKVLKKPNGGKASALNYGLLFAKGEIVITIDSDSMVARDAIDEVVRIMRNARVTAVAGNIRVLNSKSFITRVQELEYITSINLIRRSFAIFGCVMVVPGAFGVFRKRDIREVGGYDKDTLTEDFDLTIKLLKTGGEVASSSTGLAYTEVPSSWKALYKQRLRWSTGTFQTVYKHRDVRWNERYGLLHSFVIPMIILSLFNPIASFLALGTGMLLALTGGLFLFLKLITLFIMVQYLVVFVALSLDGERYRLALYAPFFVFGYKQFVDSITIISAVRAAFGKKEWHKIDRSGGMQAVRVTRNG